MKITVTIEKCEPKESKDSGNTYYEISAKDLGGKPFAFWCKSVEDILDDEGNLEVDSLYEVITRGSKWIYRIRKLEGDLSECDSLKSQVLQWFSADYWTHQSVKEFMVSLGKSEVFNPLSPISIERILSARAACMNHHKDSGGLVRHIREILSLGESLISWIKPHFGLSIVKDIFKASAILHDLGKTEEYLPDWVDDKGVQRYKPSSEMDLLGHVSYGSLLVEKYWPSDPMGNPIDLDTKLRLQHSCLAHHGKIEWGSPVTPKTPEAFLLHQCDYLSATWTVIQDKCCGDNSFTKMLNTRVYES